MEGKIKIDKLEYLTIKRNLNSVDKENCILKRQLKEQERVINAQNDRIEFLYKDKHFWFTKANEYWNELNKINN